VSRIRRTIAALLAGSVLLAVLAVPASAATPSVADVLGRDGVAFDTNWYDFDIVEKAALTVIDAKDGQTTVAALADADAALTVFAPNDRAFQVLVYSLTGRWYWSEAKVFEKLVEAVGGLVGPAATIDTIEAVLLYHVVGGKVTSSQVPSLNGKDVETVGGATFRVKVGWLFTSLVDKDPDALNPTLVKSKLDIPAGNSVIHGISLVLRPLDLPRGY
jgi:uncharacterized surface protein with fasciclin (FAS1) repeats